MALPSSAEIQLLARIKITAQLHAADVRLPILGPVDIHDRDDTVAATAFAEGHDFHFGIFAGEEFARDDGQVEGDVGGHGEGRAEDGEKGC